MNKVRQWSLVLSQGGHVTFPMQFPPRDLGQRSNEGELWISPIFICSIFPGHILLKLVIVLLVHVKRRKKGGAQFICAHVQILTG